MDKIFEALMTLLDNPVTDFFQWLGLSAAFSKAFSAAFGALLTWLIVEFLKKLYQRYKNIKIARDLVHFQYDFKDVKQKRDLFIPTQGQNNSPTYEEEPEQTTQFIVKKPLIPFFIKTAFNKKKDSNKFYLILADSGMGKTTFMINLYLQYHSFFNFRRKYKMLLFPFGDADIIKWIKAIEPEEARDTILLLDAFDECKALLPPEEADGLTDDKRFHKVLDEIIKSVKDFREVVITSRTQYFPGQEDKPYEIEIPRFGSEGFHTLAKLYISPFEEKEIKRYLNKKYGILRLWNLKKKQTATLIVKNSPRLMVRPMLLSYINYLVDGTKQKYEKTYQIYETLINKWIERESEKRRYQSEGREKFKRDLYDFSRLVALEIYNKVEQKNMLSKEQAVAICNKNNIDLRGYEITGQSLLTRDASQNWKFAHKSILEYFLALECVDDWQFAVNFKFAGMDMAQHFYSEMAPYGNALNFVFVKGGKFKMGDEQGDLQDYCRPIHEVFVSDFFIAKMPVTQKLWLEIMGNNPSRFKDNENCPVENVSWNDAQQFIEKLKTKIGQKFRLPTEAEWEYAARGGPFSPFEGGQGDVHIGKYKYAGSDDLDEVGWYTDNAGSKTHPVATKKPNELGIYDMSGNVWEWCQDWYGEKYYDECKKQRIVNNPTGPKTGSRRVLRGGSWRNYAQRCRSAYRDGAGPGSRSATIGFRLVFVP